MNPIPIFNRSVNLFKFRALTVGPFAENPFMGPLVSSEHLEKVRSYIRLARADGGTVLCGETVDALCLSASHQKVPKFHRNSEISIREEVIFFFLKGLLHSSDSHHRISRQFGLHARRNFRTCSLYRSF